MTANDARGRAIEAGMRATKGFDRFPVAVVVDVVTPIIRADERERIAQEVRDGCHHWRDDIKPCLTCRPIADRIARGA